MTFRRLAEFFEKLESTSSRNSMVEILAELFSEADVEEIDKIAYLTQGRVAPMFEPEEMGMAEKMVAKAIARAYGKGESDIASEFKKRGDLGDVAEEISRRSEKSRNNKGKDHGKNHSVLDVFYRLEAIAFEGGEGSVEKKISILSDLLSHSDPLSARFIARIPVDKMRLGFSDQTVLEGLSWMIDGTKKHKKEIEAAYNIRPDLGEIAKEVKSQKLKVKSIDKIILNIKPKVGTPVLVMRAERLISAKEIIEQIGECCVEPKLDGLRTQLHFSRIAGSENFLSSSSALNSSRAASAYTRTQKKHPHQQISEKVTLFSRGLENVTQMYPELVEATLAELDCESVILDGEAIGFDYKTGKYLQFQETVQRKRKYDVDEFSKNIPLKLVVFDCLYLNGESLIDRPYSERRTIVEKILSQGNQRDSGDVGRSIVAAEKYDVKTADELEKYFHEFLKRGLEGIMAKKKDGVYQAGARGWNWIKLKGSYDEKLSDTIDAVVMGVDFGKGKRSGFGVGAFLIGVFDTKTDSFKTISKVGTGLTDEEWRALAASSKRLALSEKPKNYEVNKIMDCDVWMKPELVGEFKADQLTKSPMHTAGFALRFPRLVRWREKKAEDSTSLGEIKGMAGKK